MVNPAGHAWNQIKLDGNWYNSDLTITRDAIIDFKNSGTPSENICPVLANDEEFYSGIFEVHGKFFPTQLGHGMFSVDGDTQEVCNDKINAWDLISYLRINYINNTDCRTWLRNASTPLRTSLVKPIGRMLDRIRNITNAKDRPKGTKEYDD